MLSRVADSLYWMSRYLERAEHAARLIDVHMSLMLEQSAAQAGRRWSQVARALQLSPPPGAAGNSLALTHWLAFDHSNRSSIVSYIMSARENARQVREQISSEMWEQLNRLFHEVRRSESADLWERQPFDFILAVKEGVHLFQGITDTTMNHNQGWRFIQAGRFLERACAVSELVGLHYQTYSGGTEVGFDADDHLEWIGLLRSCAAFEAYCKVYTAELDAQKIAEFVLLNPEFPHSVRFSADQLQAALAAIDAAGFGRRAGTVERLAGRLKSYLDFAQIGEVMSGGLHGYLESVQRQCAHIHNEMYQVYIEYPIEALLEA